MTEYTRCQFSRTASVYGSSPTNSAAAAAAAVGASNNMSGTVIEMTAINRTKTLLVNGSSASAVRRTSSPVLRRYNQSKPRSNVDRIAGLSTSMSRLVNKTSPPSTLQVPNGSRSGGGIYLGNGRKRSLGDLPRKQSPNDVIESVPLTVGFNGKH